MVVRMVRTQIQLTEEQYEALKARAAEQGLSLATIIRQGLDLILVETPQDAKRNRINQALSMAGKFHSGVSDLSANHDKYPTETYPE